MLIQSKLIVIFIIKLFFVLIMCRRQKVNNQGEKFDYHKQYSGKLLLKVYSQYLSAETSNKNCQQKSKTSDITEDDLAKAFSSADKQRSRLMTFNQGVLASVPKAKIFDSNLYETNNQAKYHEYATKNLVDDKCLGKLESVINLKKVAYSNKFVKSESSCDVIPSVKCDPKHKYRRIDGKCNNLVNTNWGSNFHCQRRLLPPDYSDGVSRLRTSTNGSPLPCPRRLSKELFTEKVLDSKFSALQTMWGQLIAHDTFNRVTNFGGELNCCPQDGSALHPDCLPILDLPRDNLTIAYGQNCMSFTRALTCNTCQLGPRHHMNWVTSFLDLSQVYGLTENITNTLRTFSKGELKVGKASDGSQILPKAELPADQDRIDLSDCKPLKEQPLSICFKNGDGMRGNQNPAATSLVILLVRRHNQHSRGLSTANPTWNDEKLFQEARKLSIAEYNRIIFGEYLPTILGNHMMKKFDLKVRKNGFTKYNPNVDPNGIQSVGGAAFRFGHLSTKSSFHVSQVARQDSYNYNLKDKFMEMSDIWKGKTNGIIRGLTEIPAKQIGPNFANDLQNHLFFDKTHPRISDLAAFNIMRGRDYGLPSYIYYLQFLKGVQIKSWEDLSKHISQNRVNKLKNIYNDYKDIDLYVGGALESNINTFKRLLGLQFFHWKFGDRFYFEHSGQSGSFTINQLNNIRSTASLANLLCKTTDFDSIPGKPFLVASKSNSRLSCQNLKDLNYNLFH